jgi:hypothetical protein
LDRWTIDNFIGGGIVLGYRCTNSCRHCLYACGPYRKDGKPSPKELTKLLDCLVEWAPRANYHIGGGEPFIDVPLLKQAIVEMEERQLSLDYVETNAGWVRDENHARQVLLELGRLGLKGLLVSVSLFHAEQIPFDKTMTLIEAAQRELINGCLIWLPHFINVLSAFDSKKRVDLESLLKKKGDTYAVQMAQSYGLIPAGRAGRFFARHGLRYPAEQVAGRPPCQHRLWDTSHFHVDGQGRYVPGFCAGLTVPMAELVQGLELSRYPVVQTLLRPDGLSKLLREAIEMGFVPLEGYSAACDLCTHLRLFLYQHRPTPDLGPEGFYLPQALPGY